MNRSETFEYTIVYGRKLLEASGIDTILNEVVECYIHDPDLNKKHFLKLPSLLEKRPKPIVYMGLNHLCMRGADRI